MDPTEVEPFKRGDRAALERVYRRHVAQIERFVRAALLRSGRFSGANLADLVQDVFMRAFSESARASYDATRDYAPFLTTLARNVVIDWHRRSSREPVDTRELETFLDSLESVPHESAAFAPELVSVVASYVERLSPELRGVHERRFVAAEPQESAALALGISRQTLRTLEKKLVEGLRRELRDHKLSEGRLQVAQPVRPSGS
jgi:RNA polymerase sigma-70 factor (ECF subfamily)